MKRGVKAFLLLALYLFSFRVLVKYPIPFKYEVEAFFIVVLILFAIYFWGKELVLNRSESGKSAFSTLILINMIIPVVGAYSAKLAFYQPVYYGFLAQRSYYFAISGLLTYYLLNKKIIELKEIEKLFLFIAWSVFLISIGLEIFVPVERLVVGVEDRETYRHFVEYNFYKGGYKYRFDLLFYAFGCIYYFMQDKRRKYFSFIPALIFFAYILYSKKRTYLMGMFVVSIVMLVKFTKAKRTIYLTGCIVVSVSLALLLDANYWGILGKEITHTRELISYAFSAIVGEGFVDTSAQARIDQFDVAVREITMSPLLGVGRISYRWGGGFTEMYGIPFYVDDIGIFGVILQYGILGSIVIYALYGYLIAIAWRTGRTGNTFVTTCAVMTILVGVISLINGYNVTHSGVMTILASVPLYYHGIAGSDGGKFRRT